MSAFKKPTPLVASIDDVQRLAFVACDLDVVKSNLPAEQCQKLVVIVAQLHDMAEQLDLQYGFGLYALEAA